MAVRDDILNFMRQIKSGKQSVAESEWKQGAYAEASAAHQESLEQYATQLTAFETDLAGYEQRVGAWEADTKTKQSSYETAMEKFPAAKKKYDDAVVKYTGMYGDPSTWNDQVKSQFKTLTGGYVYGSPPTAPTLPVFLPQPATLEAQHPGAIPSFEFAVPETPYTAALAKSSQASAMPRMGPTGGENNYYRALEAAGQSTQVVGAKPMINLDQQGQRRPMPQQMAPQQMPPQAAGGGQPAAGPAVLFRPPPGTPTAGGQPPPPGAGPPGSQPPAQQPVNPMERFQMEQAKLQELYGIIGQAQAKLESVRTAMGKKSPADKTQYEQAVKGPGHANR